MTPEEIPRSMRPLKVLRAAAQAVSACILALGFAAGAALIAQGAAAAGPFLTGGDVSMLPRLEELGAVYRDAGEPADALAVLMDHGCNAFRVRLFVNPSGRDGVVQDLDYVIGLARRIKHAGAVLLLDIHYSDTWADPGHQAKPAAWRGLSCDELEARVDSYTADVIGRMKAAGCLPDIIQIGNEVTGGFLWPDGKLGPGEAGWDRFATLLEAGIRGARRPLQAGDELAIMIHIDRGGDTAGVRWYFRHLAKRGVDFDLIGLSWYPWWHGSFDGLKRTLAQTATTFGKPIVVVETAYPWRPGDVTGPLRWPQTPAGQRRFLRDVIAAVRKTPGGLGRGVMWWYPESIPVRGLHVWKGGRMALFDAAGNALPALDAFGFP